MERYLLPLAMAGERQLGIVNYVVGDDGLSSSHGRCARPAEVIVSDLVVQVLVTEALFA